MLNLLRLTFAFLLLAASCAPQQPRTARQQPMQPDAALPASALVVQSTPLPLRIDDAAVRQLGRLLWRGGVSLTANDKDFGGWSDLHVAPDGRTLHSVSDEGHWLAAEIVYDAEGNLAALARPATGPLRGLDGKPLGDKRLSDAESLARLPDESWLVGFERDHRLWRYPTGSERDGKGLAGLPAAVEGPPELARQPLNGGLEAMVGLADGRVVILSEEYTEQAGTTVGWVGEPVGASFRWQRFHYATIPDFRVTAIARLPDGGFVVLERAFDPLRGVRCRIVQIAAAQFVAGATVQGEEVARLAVPYQVDNLEGIAATRGPRGEMLLWLLSDNNFNRLQRTILLLFELK
jgi:hypothetical protein